MKPLPTSRVGVVTGHTNDGPQMETFWVEPLVCKQFRLRLGHSWSPISASGLAEALATQSTWPLVLH